MGKTGMAIMGTVAMLLGLLLSLFLFIYLPAVFTGWCLAAAPAALKAVVEGAIKILIFFGYLMLVSLMPGYAAGIPVSWRGAQIDFLL